MACHGDIAFSLLSPTPSSGWVRGTSDKEAVRLNRSPSHGYRYYRHVDQEGFHTGYPYVLECPYYGRDILEVG